MSVVLVGQPELRDRLALRKNRSLWSRIHTRVSLGEARPDDTAEYLRYRLEHVGGDLAKTIDSDAIALLHETTEGRLRDLDRLTTDALLHAARRKLPRVDRSVVQRVVDADDDPLFD